jgi:hypothetical protein
MMELVHGSKIHDYIAYQRYRFNARDYHWIWIPRDEMTGPSTSACRRWTLRTSRRGRVSS